jgi:REP element-mobilizing transposase RayT
MKPGAYSQLYIHIVFSPKYREALINSQIENLLYPHIGQLLKNKGHKPININGMRDHLHILIGLNPKQAISDLIADIKRSSSLFINDKKIMCGNFAWQDGYGVFSYGRSQLNSIYEYIQDQKNHHQKKTFKEEYMDMLKKFDVDFKEEYLFEFFD